MRFTRSLKSSAHSLPSPDGAHIATILPSKLILRTTRSLELLRVIALPTELPSSVQWFLWSPSSRRVLICGADCVCIYSIRDQQFSAKITNPTAGTAKITYLAFGATDDEILVFSDFGLKLTVFSLISSTSIEIASPKFYNVGNSAKGYAYRPRTTSVALLTRTSGKDMVSIHARGTYEVIRSWNTESIDAQSLSWSPDGRWLAVIESAGQGHKILFYTADGHIFKIWNGPIPASEEDKDLSMGAGVRMVDWASSGDFLAECDSSAQVVLLSAPKFMSTLSLRHTSTIQPVGGLQIWQEQVTPSPSGVFDRTFTLCANTTCPPTAGVFPIASDAGVKSGINVLTFDNSGTLLATRSENMPTTLWIWDIASKVLKVVMVLHAPLVKVTWHPVINELLMIRCEGEDSKGLVHLWEPSWDSPKILDFGTQLPEGKIIGKSVVRWLNVESNTPCVFFSDTQDCILVSLTESDDEDLPWQDTAVRGVDIYGQREESPLELVGVDESKFYGKAAIDAMMNGDPTMTGMTGGSNEVDDTFRFKKFVD